jgi:hypothetical protein
MLPLNLSIKGEIKMKIYAKQVPPEYQESPLFYGDEFWPENVFVFGNRDFNQHADTLNDLKTALENIVEVFDDMQYGEGWTNDLAHAIQCELPEEYRREYSRPERLKLVRLAQDYGFAKSYEENDILCKVLELITGETWDNSTIRGCCQGDWQEIIFPAKYGREWLEHFETEYFNTGTEWIIDPDGDNISVYAHEWNNDGIRKELAAAVGVEPENIIMQAFSGWTKTAAYMEV